MTDPVAVWHAEHQRFASLLDCLERDTAAFHRGDDPDYQLMRDVVHYLHHYADLYHHPREDVAFDRLMRRAPELSLGIHRLLQEHRVLAALGETLLKHLEEVLEDVVIERATLETAAATYLVYYRHHLDVEEQEVLPRAAALLTPTDWAAVATAVQSDPDPVFGDSVAEQYRDLRRRMTAKT